MHNILLLTLLLCSNSFAAGSFGGSTVPPGTGSTAYLKDGKMTLVADDTVTPANSNPIPVKLSGALLGSVNQGTPNTIANAWPTKITDGTNILSVNADGSINTFVAVGSTANSPGSTTINTTAATITAPANSVGFILMNLDTSTASIRYRLGAVAAVGSGQQMQPGRDTGLIPYSGDISIIAESGVQNYDIQFITK